MAQATISTTNSDPLAAARALAPRIRELAPEIERAGRLPRELVDAMLGAGLFHMVLPRHLGGNEVDPVTAARAVEEVSAADGSAGWCVMIAAQNQGFGGFFETASIHEIWGNGGITCGVARPIGRAVVTNSPAPGYLVSGRWPFASGSSHATFFAGESVIYDGDTPRKDANGNNISVFAVIPRDSVTVYETWDTAGLRGTASNDFSCENVFVPLGRAPQMFQGPPVQDWPAYRAFPLLVVNHGSQALGVARGAIETATELAKTKAGYGGVLLKDVARTQFVIAEATALREAASEYLYAATQRLWDAVVAGAPEDDTVQLRSRTRLAAAHAARASVQAVDMVYAALGTSAVFKKTPLERHFRDIHTAAAHVMVGTLVMEAAGRVELGMSAEFPFF
jgi:alkylation response protein AidB-like acyl-CoA dehydrogenase